LTKQALVSKIWVDLKNPNFLFV